MSVLRLDSLPLRCLRLQLREDLKYWSGVVLVLRFTPESGTVKNMGIANIKLPSKQLSDLKRVTGEKTGQKAVQAALEAFLRLSRRRNIIQVIRQTGFRRDYDPLQERRKDA